MSLTRTAIHRFRYIYRTISPPPSSITDRFQFQRSLSHPIPKPFQFHSSSFSSSSSSLKSSDDVYPTGDFNFVPVTGFNKFTVKLKTLIALPWERIQHGSILKIILRGQVFGFPYPSLIHTHTIAFISLVFHFSAMSM
jgi:protease-4